MLDFYKRMSLAVFVAKKSGQILLTNVPRTATPRDILRGINKAGAKGVVDSQ